MQVLTNEDMEFYSELESQYIIKASECIEDVLKRLNGTLEQKGDLLPWSKTHNCIALRESEVSVWAGYNGHGKSQILGQVIAWLLKTKKCLIASMEMTPSATMSRMLRQVSTARNPSDDFVNNFMRWTDNKLWIYDQNDSVKFNRILGMIHFAAKELGITHIVIDSLMKCGIATDDLSGQKEFVDKLCWAAKNHKIHIHLVHHMRKGGERGEYAIPGKHDLRGAGEITDLVDNVFIIHRNKDKEEKVRNGYEYNESDPDCTLNVVKQRHGEWEGPVRLWYHPDSMQYTPDKNNRPIAYR